MSESSAPESAEEYYARIVEAVGDDGRLPVALEEMPGWFVYPYEVEGLRIKPLEPLGEAEADREGEAAADCWCAEGTMPPRATDWVWRNDDWVLTLAGATGAPIQLNLIPRRLHVDLPTMPDDLAADMGRLLVAVTAATDALPSVGRTFVLKIGDGAAHLHWFFFGRPARALQFRGSPFLDWEENLPRVPLDVLRRNGEFVAARLVAALGGEGPSWA
jgi:diadenosine tetraphosphate (Ap4A) HIT family hydrolase